jgi:hypothetical protein
MVQLIEVGGTEDDIIAAGVASGHQYNSQEAYEALEDLPVLLPYIGQTNDAVHAQHDGERLLFAARDMEFHADDYFVRYPEDDAKLLPASSRLWSSPPLVAGNSVAADFLSQYGIDRASAYNTKRRFALLDTGFGGTIGYWLDRAAQLTYGVKLRDTGRLDIKLVSTDNHKSLGRHILNYRHGEVPHSAEELPNTERIIGSKMFKLLENEVNVPPQRMMAIAIQLLPRYHEAFTDLVWQADGSVMAVPDTHPNGPRRSSNASRVDPIAAAIAQYRVVQNALQQK